MIDATTIATIIAIWIKARAIITFSSISASVNTR
jgi:hypothetical protein